MTQNNINIYNKIDFGENPGIWLSYRVKAYRKVVLSGIINYLMHAHEMTKSEIGQKIGHSRNYIVMLLNIKTCPITEEKYNELFLKLNDLLMQLEQKDVKNDKES